MHATMQTLQQLYLHHVVYMSHNDVDRLIHNVDCRFVLQSLIFVSSMIMSSADHHYIHHLNRYEREDWIGLSAALLQRVETMVHEGSLLVRGSCT